MIAPEVCITSMNSANPQCVSRDPYHEVAVVCTLVIIDGSSISFLNHDTSVNLIIELYVAAAPPNPQRI